MKYMDKTSTKTNSEETASDIGRFSFRQDFPRIFFLALVYFLAHGISFFFPDSGKVIMLVWPAGGIGLAAFLLNRRRLWPFLTLAFFITGITADLLLAHRSLLSGVGFYDRKHGGIHGLRLAHFIRFRGLQEFRSNKRSGCTNDWRSIDKCF